MPTRLILVTAELAERAFDVSNRFDGGSISSESRSCDLFTSRFYDKKLGLGRVH